MADKYRKLSNTLLPSILIFTEWATENSDVLRQYQALSPVALTSTKDSSKRRGNKKIYNIDDSPSRLPRDSQQNIWHLTSSSDVLQSENRAKNGMKNSLAALSATLEGGSGTTLHGTSVTIKPSDQPNVVFHRTDQLAKLKGGTAYTGEAHTTLESSLYFQMPVPLRELMELRGFLPVVTRIEVIDVNYCH